MISLLRLVKLAGSRHNNSAGLVMGDERGLLLVMKRGRILNFNPASDEKAARIYPTGVSLHGQSAGDCRIAGFPYEITVRST